MLKKTVKFIHNLRIFFFALILLSFMFYLGLNPVDIGRFAGAKLGRAVGMTMSVPENPFNKLARQLQDKESDLALKEKELTSREAALAEQERVGNQPLLVAILIGIGALFVLIVLNYYLDFRRREREKLK